jgi:hypothetical protein
MQGNQRLADAIRQRGWTSSEVATQLGVDPKTVERWVVTGRTPHPRWRERAAALLGVPIALLWPDAGGVMDGTSELVGIYRTRTELAPSTVRSLLVEATESVDLLAYAALWLWDSVPGFAETLAAKVAEGVKVRLCIGDPDSTAVVLRGEEEGIGDRLVARCRLAATYAKPVAAADPGAVRCSGVTLYSSMLRFDHELLVNMHLWGNAAADSPVLHLRKRDDAGVAANFTRSFDRIWDCAQPLALG